MIMRKIGALFAAVACMAMAGPAFASSFTGPGGTITVTGSTSMSASGFPTLACSATFTGVINADGTATINTASFTGGLLGACATVKLATPFKIVANSTTSVTVQQLKVTAPITCGPQDVAGSWTNGSPSHFDIPTATVNPGGCTITAHLTVSGVTIV
jgi:hypothetical protein